MKQLFYHLISIIIWGIAITKLFIFDIDLLLVNNYLPEYSWLFDFKIVFILSLILVVWLSLGNEEFLKIFIFVLFYPLILLFWSIPKSLLLRRRWFLIFTYISGITSTITNFKKNLILFTLFSISFIIVFSTSNIYALYTAIGILLLISIFVIFRKVYFAFSPSAIFAINTKSIVTFLKGKDFGENLLKEDSEITKNELEPSDSVSKKEHIHSKLPMLILMNRGLFFIAEKLKRFKESRVYVIFFILSLLVTLCVSVVLFGLINYAIFKIDPLAFTIIGNENFFIFLYYSFNALIINSISLIEPISMLAMLINMFQIMYGIILIIILVGILISVNTQKYKDDIDQVIFAFNIQGENVEKAMKIKFKMDIRQAIDELEAVKHELVTFLKYIDPDY